MKIGIIGAMEEALRKEGYIILSKSNSGYIYNGHDDKILCKNEILRYLGNIDEKVIVCEETLSTNLQSKQFLLLNLLLQVFSFADL